MRTKMFVNLPVKDLDRSVDFFWPRGAAPKEATEQPGMYGRSFSDLDGHLWELLWMDPAAMGR